MGSGTVHRPVLLLYLRRERAKAVYPIERVEPLNAEVTRMVVRAPEIARKIKPGQFIMLRIDEVGERIPLTIADYDREGGRVKLSDAARKMKK